MKNCIHGVVPPMVTPLALSRPYMVTYVFLPTLEMCRAKWKGIPWLPTGGGSSVRVSSQPNSREERLMSKPLTAVLSLGTTSFCLPANENRSLYDFMVFF